MTMVLDSEASSQPALAGPRILGFEDGGACGYYRVRLPFDEMRRRGMDVAYLREGAVPPETKVVVGQRVGLPGWETNWFKIWRSQRIVWETDDDLWTIDPTNTRAHAEFTPTLLEALVGVVRIAHLVTVTTPHLAEVMARFNRNVAVLPNCVDDALFDVARPQRDRVVIGWAGGDSHLKDWVWVAPHLRRFLSRNPAVEMHTIGVDYGRAVGISGRHTPWAESLFDYYRTIDFDIGICPLAPLEFNRSKSHIKALEFASLGIPVIASDREPYRDFVVDGVTGFLVRHPHEWEVRLRELASDEAMRTEMGRAAKERARGYAIGEGWRLWADAYQSLT